MPSTLQHPVLALALPGAANSSVSFMSTRAFTIVDVAALCTTVGAGGTLTLNRKVGIGAANAVSSVMACDTASNLIRTTATVLAERVVAVGDVLIVAIGGGLLAPVGTALVYVIPTPIVGNS